MQSGVKTLSAGGGASLCCLLLLWLIYSHLLREGQLAVGTCEIVMLNRDSSVPRRTIARQTARCACRRGQIAGTTRARPACVDGNQETEYHLHLVHLNAVQSVLMLNTLSSKK
ncbi:chemokine-like protein TAFA-3 isoform X3 [Notolabrus celidotus]|uniref:chemokine-like protein TAFA-3 isoform X3 n=1 Tax=Notolabrus celidotus TaxID=1203425 RepID=UPI00148F9E7A|nr:chemokine-like protein TAFA-3 isoform X3 [Notolabrus celidotus]